MDVVQTYHKTFGGMLDPVAALRDRALAAPSGGTIFHSGEAFVPTLCEVDVPLGNLGWDGWMEDDRTLVGAPCGRPGGDRRPPGVGF